MLKFVYKYGWTVAAYVFSMYYIVKHWLIGVQEPSYVDATLSFALLASYMIGNCIEKRFGRTRHVETMHVETTPRHIMCNEATLMESDLENHIVIGSHNKNNYVVVINP